MILNVLQVLKNHCKLILFNKLTTRYEDPDGKEFDMLWPIISGENELPNPKGIKKSKILSI